MNAKAITEKRIQTTKSIIGLLDTLGEVDLNGEDQVSMVDEDGTEIILAFQTSGTTDKPIGVHTLTLRKNGLNTVITREFDIA
ncbi:MAG: hypothetical protein ABIQ64_01030 [Candidatus Saccharimonadales bacterium]